MGGGRFKCEKCDTFYFKAFLWENSLTILHSYIIFRKDICILGTMLNRLSDNNVNYELMN